MLDFTTRYKFVPGTNIAGDMASADWRFLLPNQEIQKIMFIGVPSLSTLSTLSSVGQEVLVLSQDIPKLDKMNAAVQKRGLRNIYPMAASNLDDLHLLVGSINVLIISSIRDYWRIVGKNNAHAKLKVLLKLDGLLYFERSRPSDYVFVETILRKFFFADFKSTMALWNTPFRGEIRTMVPVQDADISSYFFTNVLYGQSLKKRLLSRLGTSLSKSKKIDMVMSRQSLFVQRDTATQGALPDYLIRLAAENNIDLSEMRFGFSARGKYNSNKVIFYLFRQSAAAPEMIIKMTRSSKYNDRLENEYRMLAELDRAGKTDPESFPKPLFFGYHNNLAILCQKAIHGKPFRAVTEATPTCTYGRAAMDWIVDLGCNSADRKSVSGTEMAKTLSNLFNQFAAIYDLSDTQRSFLEKQISVISRTKEAIPVVFQHGDPGTWNIFVSDAGQVVFLDWESGEPEGMPLWDLFYFFRTYVSWMSRKAGNHNPLASVKEHLLAESPMSALMTQLVHDMSKRIGLPDQLIMPLFYTCWMHRALKESARLALDKLNQGHYFKLLCLCMEHRDAPVLQELFQPASDSNQKREQADMGIRKASNT